MIKKFDVELPSLLYIHIFDSRKDFNIKNIFILMRGKIGGSHWKQGVSNNKW